MEMLPRKLKATSSANGVDNALGMCIAELLASTTGLHQLHLKVTGTGSYATHKALNELYDALPGLIDTVVEGYQGASEKLLQYPKVECKIFADVPAVLEFLREKCANITELQGMVPYSEVVNNMDLIKDAMNAAKYKLLFLK